MASAPSLPASAPNATDDDEAHRVVYEQTCQLVSTYTTVPRRLAGFVGRPLNAEEQATGVDEAIVKACSVRSLLSLEVNRSGTTELELTMRNEAFFRRVLDYWPDYLTPDMAKRINEITERKLRGSGLVLPAMTIS